MQNLSDDILFLIFRQIPWPNRVLLEGVSPRWRFLIRKLFKRIDFFRIPEYFTHRGNIHDTVRGLVETRRHAIGGLIVERSLPHRHLQNALDVIFYAQPEKFMLFSLKDRENHRIFTPGQMESIRTKVLEHAFNLEDLSLWNAFEIGEVDLSNQHCLKRLSMRNAICVNCTSHTITVLNLMDVTYGDEHVHFSQLMIPIQNTLKSLDLERIRCNDAIPKIQYTFPNLMSLRIFNCRLPMIDIDLSASILLENIEIYYATFSSCTLDFGTFARLSYFSIDDVRSDVIYSNIGLLVQPIRLRHLTTFKLSTAFDSDSFVEMMRALARNHHALEFLKIECVDLQTEIAAKVSKMLPELLEGATSLKEIELINFRCDSSQLISAVTKSRDILKRLCLINSCADEVFVEALNNTLKSLNYEKRNTVLHLRLLSSLNIISNLPHNVRSLTNEIRENYNIQIN